MVSSLGSDLEVAGSNTGISKLNAYCIFTPRPRVVGILVDKGHVQNTIDLALNAIVPLAPVFGTLTR